MTMACNPTHSFTRSSSVTLAPEGSGRRLGSAICCRSRFHSGGKSDLRVPEDEDGSFESAPILRAFACKRLLAHARTSHCVSLISLVGIQCGVRSLVHHG